MKETIKSSEEYHREVSRRMGEVKNKPVRLDENEIQGFITKLMGDIREDQIDIFRIRMVIEMSGSHHGKSFDQEASFEQGQVNKQLPPIEEREVNYEGLRMEETLEEISFEEF